MQVGVKWCKVTLIIIVRGVETLSCLPNILTYFHHSFLLPIYFVYLPDTVLHDWLFPHHCIYTDMNSCLNIPPITIHAMYTNAIILNSHCLMYKYTV